MAITIRQSTNTALQYNNAGLSEYLIADNATDKKFLTNAPTRRTLRQNELSVIDFLLNDTSFTGGLLKEYKDKDGNILFQSMINLSSSNLNVHNSVNVDWSETDIPDGVVSQCISITENGNLLLNPNFEEGSGDTFTEWTKVLTSATNEIVYSQELSNALEWNASFPVTANATTAPDGTATADKIVEDNCVGCYASITQEVNLSNQIWCLSVYLKASERDIGYLILQDSVGTYYATWFDLAGGLVLTNNNDQAGIEDVGNGWFRCYIVKDNIDLTGGSSAVFISPTDADNTEIYDCVAGNGIFAWGAQLEVGDTPTSYKVTTGSPVTADEGSVVQATRTNLILQSQTFDNASWVKVPLGGTALTTIVVSNSTTAPDGTLTADTIEMSLGGGTTTSDRARLQQVVTIPTNNVYTFSFWIWATDVSQVGKIIRLTTPIINYDFAIPATPTRMEFTESLISGSVSYLFELRGAQGLASTANFYLWGAQLEQSPYASDYIPTTIGPATIEDGREGIIEATNLIVRSQEFGDANWTKTNISLLSDITIAPDGTTTAERVLASSAINEVYQTISSDGPTTFSIYAKKNTSDYIWFDIYDDGGSDYFAIFNIANGTYVGSAGGNAVDTFKIEDAGNGWYRLEITKYFNYGLNDRTFYFGVAQAGNVANAIPGTSIFVWGAQAQEAFEATEYIPTTSAPVTTNVQGVSRAPRFNRLTRDVALYQAVTTIGVQYRLQFWAKYYEGFPEIAITDGSVVYESIPLTNEDYQLFDVSFTATSGQLHIVCASGTDSAIAIDDVVLVDMDTKISEERCFTLDANCYEYENQIQWINKLGGKDTFVFTGRSILEKAIEREGLIKYPMTDNFSAPNAIYQNRSIKSREIMTIFTRCENEETARWLRDELNDCIALYLLVGTEYYPIIPEVASVQVYNENGFNYNVSLKFRFAFDVNIQTI